MRKPHLYNTNSCHTLHTWAANNAPRQWKSKPRRTDLSALFCDSTHSVKVVQKAPWQKWWYILPCHFFVISYNLINQISFLFQKLFVKAWNLEFCSINLKDSRKIFYLNIWTGLVGFVFTHFSFGFPWDSCCFAHSLWGVDHCYPTWCPAQLYNLPYSTWFRGFYCKSIKCF